MKRCNMRLVKKEQASSKAGTVRRTASYRGSHSDIPPYPGGVAVLTAPPIMQARCLHHHEDSFNRELL